METTENPRVWTQPEYLHIGDILAFPIYRKDPRGPHLPPARPTTSVTTNIEMDVPSHRLVIAIKLHRSSG